MRRWMALAGLLALFALIVPSHLALAHELCFADKTPFCLKDPFSDYWEQNGGLPVFGYPLAAAADQLNADTNKTHLTQVLERTRLEDHPENQGTPYRILLGLIGKERLKQLGRDWAAEPRATGPMAGCLWFAETGHNVCNQSATLGFKRYWESNGLALPGQSAYARSLQLFGLPLTEPKMEQNSSGDTVLTQWFERARFEWHPNNPDQFKVLLGLLGKEVLASRPPVAGTSTPPTTGTMTPPTTGTVTPPTTGTGTPPTNGTATPTATGTPPTNGTATPTVTVTATPTGTPRMVSPTPGGPCRTPAANPPGHGIQVTATSTPALCPER